jgi:hypothetical protein
MSPKKVNKERKKTTEIKEIKDRHKEMFDLKPGEMRHAQRHNWYY